jgi:catabolite regulation protein CreA
MAIPRGLKSTFTTVHTNSFVTGLVARFWDASLTSTVYSAWSDKFKEGMVQVLLVAPVIAWPFFFHV